MKPGIRMQPWLAAYPGRKPSCIPMPPTIRMKYGMGAPSYFAPLGILSLERSIHADSLGELSNLGVGLVVIGIPVALKLVVIWFLWTRADWVADKLVPQSGTNRRFGRCKCRRLDSAHQCHPTGCRQMSNRRRGNACGAA